MCEPVYNITLNLEEFLINCHSVSINRPHLYSFAARKSIGKIVSGPRCGKKMVNPCLLNSYRAFTRLLLRHDLSSVRTLWKEHKN